jgi:thioredoxin reductase (NADPH)
MITADALLAIPLFSKLPDHERESLAARVADIRLRPDDWLQHEGETPAFNVVLEGRLAVYKHVAGHDHQVETFTPGTFFGEIPLLLGTGALSTVRATEPARVMRLTGPDFHQMITSCPVLNAEILRTMADRIGKLQQFAVTVPIAEVTVTGPRLDPACHTMRDFLVRNQIAFRWVDPATPDARPADDDAAGDSDHAGPWPSVRLADGEHMVCPSLREVAERVGLQTRAEHEKYDVVIVGAGPAGLAAAVYGASEGLRTVLIERVAPGGQAGTSSLIENYLGFPSGLSGDDLSLRARQQAVRFGAEVLIARYARGISADGDGQYAIALDGDEQVRTASVILATGVEWRRLAVPGADTLLGRGVYYGAAQTEATSVRGKPVFLVGGGNSAGQAAMLFSNYADHVTLLVRGAGLADSMSQYLIDQLAGKANVQIETHSEVVAMDGTESLEAIVVANRQTGETARHECAGLFVFIGARPETDWLPASVIRDQWDYVCAGRDVMDLMRTSRVEWPLERDPYLLETSVPGIFAAGDLRHGSVKRVASAVGEGGMAISFAQQYLAERRSARVS